MKLYGIPNCNTVKKALDWLKANEIVFEFHDFKKQGVSETKLKEWSEQSGWEALINKRGTTWKKLDPETQNSVVSEDTAFAVMQDKPSMIKRPVIETSKGLLIGFDENKYAEYLK
ncbi:ArsC family reductase [Flavihumibacter sp. R14]|nr:ArsC family reductase [Flavihumibacter soli]